MVKKSGEGADSQEAEIHIICGYFCAASLLLLLIVGAVVKRKRPPGPRHPGDGLLNLRKWGTPGYAFAFLLEVLVLLPLLIFMSAYVLGGILAAIEGWNFHTGFEYVLCNSIGIGPMDNVTPSSTIGNIADVLVSMWALLLTSTILGLAAAFGASAKMAAAVPNTMAGLFRCFLIWVPLTLLFLAVLSGAIMAWLEDWDVSEGFLFMIGAMCGIEDPLTPVSPESQKGNFFAAICYMLELSVGGVIIGIVGGHPVALNLVHLLDGYTEEGLPPETDGEDAKAVDLTPETANADESNSNDSIGHPCQHEDHQHIPDTFEWRIVRPPCQHEDQPQHQHIPDTFEWRIVSTSGLLPPLWPAHGTPELWTEL